MKVSLFDLSEKAMVNNDLVKKLLDRVVKDEQANIAELNVIVASDVYLQRLNRNYFSKDSTTNVLAFGMEETSEIYVSYEQATSLDELYYFIVHGLLHIIGYNHDTQSAEVTMHKKCLAYLKTVIADLQLQE